MNKKTLLNKLYQAFGQGKYSKVGELGKDVPFCREILTVINALGTEEKSWKNEEREKNEERRWKNGDLMASGPMKKVNR